MRGIPARKKETTPERDEDGHLITADYDLPQPAPHAALPVIIAVIKTPAFISFRPLDHLATTLKDSGTVTTERILLRLKTAK
jgi:hypothetical protein